MTITIADGVELPDQIVTETLAFLAKRGGGKSNAAVVLAEGMWDAGFQWVAIDPKGDWWGIRASADGKGEGLPVLIVGGQHGDLPLSSNQGSQWAHQVIQRNLTVLLDVSLFSKGEQIQFVTDFAETLFRAIRQAPRPLHLFLEEAEEFLPQRVTHETARMVGAYSKIAKQGRNAGLGVSLVTQRSASLNKDALSQTDTLVLFRTPSPHDRKAVVAWAEHSGDVKEIAESLSSLKPGESWMLSPGYLGLNQRFTWNRRRTFDSGATPVVGEKRPEPASLASIDLAEIKEQMAEEIERAAANDPKALQKRIDDLERQLADQVPGEPEVIERKVEVHVVPESATTAARMMVEFLEKAVRSGEDIVAACEQYQQEDDPADRYVVVPPRPAVARKPPAATPRDVPPADADQRLERAHRRILQILFQSPGGSRSLAQLATLANYHVKTKGFTNALSTLRTGGLITRGDPVSLTDEGSRAAAALPVEAIPSGPALLEHWKAQPKIERAARAILDNLAGAWPQAVDRDTLAEQCGYHPKTKGYTNALSRLRTLGLITRGVDVALTQEFGEAIQ